MFGRNSLFFSFCFLQAFWKFWNFQNWKRHPICIHISNSTRKKGLMSQRIFHYFTPQQFFILFKFYANLSSPSGWHSGTEKLKDIQRKFMCMYAEAISNTESRWEKAFFFYQNIFFFLWTWNILLRLISDENVKPSASR